MKSFASKAHLLATTIFCGAAIGLAAALLQKSRKPLFIVGAGAYRCGAKAAIEWLDEVAATLAAHPGALVQARSPERPRRGRRPAAETAAAD